MYEGKDGVEAKTNTHFILYVDGKVEQTSGRPFPITTVIDDESSVKVQFGRHHKTNSFFRGWLDEVFIVNKALEDWEVNSLMRHNRIIKEDQTIAF